MDIVRCLWIYILSSSQSLAPYIIHKSHSNWFLLVIPWKTESSRRFHSRTQIQKNLYFSSRSTIFIKNIWSTWSNKIIYLIQRLLCGRGLMIRGWTFAVYTDLPEIKSRLRILAELTRKHKIGIITHRKYEVSDIQNVPEPNQAERHRSA